MSGRDDDRDHVISVRVEDLGDDDVLDKALGPIVYGWIPGRHVEAVYVNQTEAEAIAAFERDHPEAQIEQVGDREVMGRCESCRGLVFGDEEFCADEDGVFVHAHDCMEPPR